MADAMASAMAAQASDPVATDACAPQEKAAPPKLLFNVKELPIGFVKGYRITLPLPMPEVSVHIAGRAAQVLPVEPPKLYFDMVLELMGPPAQGAKRPPAMEDQLNKELKYQRIDVPSPGVPGASKVHGQTLVCSDDEAPENEVASDGAVPPPPPTATQMKDLCPTVKDATDSGVGEGPTSPAANDADLPRKLCRPTAATDMLPDTLPPFDYYDHSDMLQPLKSESAALQASSSY